MHDHKIFNELYMDYCNRIQPGIAIFFQLQKHLLFAKKVWNTRADETPPPKPKKEKQPSEGLSSKIWSRASFVVFGRLKYDAIHHSIKNLQSLIFFKVNQ